jgi:hypothetical protein
LFSFFIAKWLPKSTNKLQEFLQNFHILFSYFRDLKLKHDFEIEKEKNNKTKRETAGQARRVRACA